MIVVEGAAAMFWEMDNDTYCMSGFFLVGRLQR